MHSTGIADGTWKKSLITDGKWNTENIEFTVTNSFPKSTEPMLAIFFDYAYGDYGNSANPAYGLGTIHIDNILIKKKITTINIPMTLSYWEKSPEARASKNDPYYPDKITMGTTQKNRRRR